MEEKITFILYGEAPNSQMVFASCTCARCDIVVDIVQCDWIAICK